MAKKQKKNSKEFKQIGSFILDRSGSMSSIVEPTIKGFNEYLKKLQDKNVPMDFTLTIFDSDGIDTLCHNMAIRKVKPLDTKSYVPRSGTPLYDAAVKTIEKLAEEVGDKNIPVSVVIMTDGQENDSREHTQVCLRDLIKKLEKKGNWTFAYMGANQDSYATASSFGISQGNTINWASTAQGSVKAFQSLANSTVNYSASMTAAGGSRGSGMLRSASFFSDEQDKQPDILKQQGGVK